MILWEASIWKILGERESEMYRQQQDKIDKIYV